jgi:hypothetical protein
MTHRRKVIQSFIVILSLLFGSVAGGSLITMEVDAAPQKKSTRKSSSKGSKSYARNRRGSSRRRSPAPVVARKSYDEIIGRSGVVGQSA